MTAANVVKLIFRASLVYWSVRKFVYWFVADVYYAMLAPLNRVATNVPEKLSVLAFVARWTLVVHRLLPKRFLSRVRGDTVIRLQGSQYAVGLESDEVSIFTEIYEQRLYDRLPDFIPQPGWTVIDAGANVGLFAIQQARRGADVYAFEPNPDSFRRLSRSIALNGLSSNLRAFNVAVGAGSGTGALRVSEGHTVGTYIASSDDPASVNDQVVQIVSLDERLPGLGITHIDLLKIDTEGAEIHVLHGAQDILASVERIVLEYHSWALLDEVLSILREHGFTERLRVDIMPAPGIGILYAAKTRST